MMEGINRDTIFSNCNDFLTTYDWDFEVVKWPAILKSDGMATKFRLRTNNIVVPEDPMVEPISVFVRGHRYSQPGDVKNYGICSFSVQDFSDQSIQRYFTQLVYLMSDPQTKAMMSGRPGLFKMNFNIYRLNAALEPVKRWRIIDALPIGINTVDDMSSEKEPLGPSALSFNCDYYVVEYRTGKESWGYAPQPSKKA